VDQQYEDVQYEDAPEQVDIEEAIQEIELDSGATLVEK